MMKMAEVTDLSNGTTYYYSIITTDSLGNISNQVNVSSTPNALADESQIPLLDVDNIDYEIVNNESISISWDNPVDFKADLTGWSDQKVLIFASITDDFGVPISETARLTLEPIPSVEACQFCSRRL